MLLLDSRVHRISALDVWWPAPVQAVTAVVSLALVITVMQCTARVAVALSSLAFRTRLFCTMLVDLSLPLKTLWSRLDQKSCRTAINRDGRLGGEISVNDHAENSLRLINELIDPGNYRRSMGPEEWTRSLVYSDVFDGRPVATHIVRVDGESRARALLAPTVRRGIDLPGSVVGALNRYLLWHEIEHYRRRGVRYFDFGGVTLDRQSPLYSIARFTLSFGGEVVEERVVGLTGDLPLRLSLRAAAGVKTLLDQWRVRHHKNECDH
jgi:hypothetical protein